MSKVVVVEDDSTINQMYCFKLKHHGYDVRSAHDGKAGLELINSFRPDLILLDLRMPVMSGEDMLQQLRETSWGGHIRVVVLTNISRDEAPMQLRLLGVDRYVVKAHHTPTQVIHIIEEVLDKQ